MKEIFFGAVLLAVLFILGLGIAPVAYAEEGYAEGRQWAQDHGVVDDDFHSEDYGMDKSENFDNGVREYALEQHQRQLQNNEDIQPDD